MKIEAGIYKVDERGEIEVKNVQQEGKRVRYQYRWISGRWKHSNFDQCVNNNADMSHWIRIGGSDCSECNNDRMESGWLGGFIPCPGCRGANYS